MKHLLTLLLFISTSVMAEAEIILNCNGEAAYNFWISKNEKKEGKKKEAHVFLITESTVYTDRLTRKVPIEYLTDTEITWDETKNGTYNVGNINRLNGEISFSHTYIVHQEANKKTLKISEHTSAT